MLRLFRWTAPAVTLTALAGVTPALASDIDSDAALDRAVDAPPIATLIADAGNGGSGMAAEDDKRFSISLSLGIAPDMASLGSTIAQDGTVDTGETTMANLLYSTDKALMSDRNNMAIWHNSSHTDSAFNLMGEEPVVGGAMLGGEIGGTVQYDLHDVADLPLFARVGFFASSRISGGDQERVFGTVAADSPTVAALLAANGEDPADYVGGRMSSSYRANFTEIPITIGLRIPIKKYHAIYGGVGVSLFSGGFSVAMDVDDNYANVLATHVDTTALTVNNLSPGAVDEVVDFRMGGMGLNYGIGAQADLGGGITVFAELNSSGAAATVYSGPMSSELRQLLTAASSETLYGEDPEWFKRLAFPVVARGASARFGVRVYLF